MYTTKFVVEVTVNHHGSCESAFDSLIVSRLSMPATERITLISGETNEDIQPQRPTEYRKEVMSVMKKVVFKNLYCQDLTEQWQPDNMGA